MTEPDSRTRIATRLRPLFAVALVACLVVGAAIPAAGLLADSATAGAPSDGGATVTDADGTAGQQRDGGGNATAAAGARLAGAIGGQQSELAGEIETRTLVVRLGRADSPAERAAVLAVLEARTDARLAALDDRRDRLRSTAANRSVSAGEYAYLAATVSVEAAVTRRLATRGERAAADLPAAVATEYGVSAERFRSLGNRSRALTDSLGADLRDLGAPRAALEAVDEADRGGGIDAEDLLEDLDDTVAPANRTNWPFEDENSTLEGAIDDLDGETGPLDLPGVRDGDGLGPGSDGRSATNATEDGGDPLGGVDTGTEADGLLDGAVNATVSGSSGGGLDDALAVTGTEPTVDDPALDG